MIVLDATSTNRLVVWMKINTFIMYTFNFRHLWCNIISSILEKHGMKWYNYKLHTFLNFSNGIYIIGYKKNKFISSCDNCFVFCPRFFSEIHLIGILLVKRRVKMLFCLWIENWFSVATWCAFCLHNNKGKR